jgi:hypothetical protein
MESQFLQAVFSQDYSEESIRHPNFFNGRILTASDLKD